VTAQGFGPSSDDRPLIAVFSGPTATILNTPPLVTSYRAHSQGTHRPERERFDVLRAQRLAAPVVVYIQAFSAHPLEEDSVHLAGPPDGWLDANDQFHEQPLDGGRAVYRVTLRPDDGLYLLPYPGRKSDGRPWEDACLRPGAPQEEVRQTFLPDASRLYEEIDRLGLDKDGANNLLSRTARFEFFRAAPSGGYKQGTSTADGGSGVKFELPGRDFYPYYPFHLRYEPTLADLAEITNLVQSVLSGGAYAGAQWLEGSPTAEETLYWFNLVIDTKVPIVGHTAQRAHGVIGSDGDRNILSGVNYIVSRVWSDESGANRLGAVLIVDEVVFSAREVAKTDARPGNYQPVGGHGGIVGSLVGGLGPFRVTFAPTALHTFRSELRTTKLPFMTTGVRLTQHMIVPVEVRVKSDDGRLVPEAMPNIGFVTFGRYSAISESLTAPRQGDVAVDAVIRQNLQRFPLAGFVGEGATPSGMLGIETDRALRVAAMSGMPVVKVSRGHPGGEANRTDPLFIAGSNLSATKARILLMACLLKLGSLPPARDPEHPSEREIAATKEAVAAFQVLFDTH
jgi:L-asparaginase